MNSTPTKENPVVFLNNGHPPCTPPGGTLFTPSELTGVINGTADTGVAHCAVCGAGGQLKREGLIVSITW